VNNIISNERMVPDLILNDYYQCIINNHYRIGIFTVDFVFSKLLITNLITNDYGSSVGWNCQLHMAIRILKDIMTYIPVDKFYNHVSEERSMCIVPILDNDPLDLLIRGGDVL